MGADPLYRRILGSDFERLPDVLKDFHSGPRQAEGEFKVTLAGGVIRSIVRTLSRLPNKPFEGKGILDVESTPPGEVWTRDIGDWRFKTRQWESDGLLFEKNRLLTLVFQVAKTAGGMTFRQVRASWWKLPLPRLFAPRIQAVVCAESNEWLVTVKIAMPLVGEVVRYEGRLAPL